MNLLYNNIKKRFPHNSYFAIIPLASWKAAISCLFLEIFKRKRIIKKSFKPDFVSYNRIHWCCIA